MAQGDVSISAFQDSRPLFYARWDRAAREHGNAGMSPRYQWARKLYFRDFAVDPAEVRTRLRSLTAGVLLTAGELDPHVTHAMISDAAQRFGTAELLLHKRAGHFPWVDEPADFAKRVAGFLDRRAP
jgi:pimeloyl-ACP methyl ester carboxylesterase